MYTNNLPKRETLSICLLRWIRPTKSWIRQQTITSPKSCIAFCVDLPDGDYSLVPETEEGGAEASLQYMEVLDDHEGASNLADEGKLRCI
jgi:hypothetical protein